MVTPHRARCSHSPHHSPHGGTGASNASPTTFDRLVTLRFGAAASHFIAEGQRNVMVASRPLTTLAVPLEEAVDKMKSVPLDSNSILTARDMGISFGDD